MKIEEHIRIPLHLVTTPRNGECKTDRWWIIDADENIILYKGFSPQCSQYKSLVERLANDLWDGATVRHIPAVYLGPVDHDGYYTNPHPSTDGAA